MSKRSSAVSPDSRPLASTQDGSQDPSDGLYSTQSSTSLGVVARRHTVRRNARIRWACLVLLCLIGTSAALYAYIVETRKEADASYKASCDISETISCSKVFTSRYGRGFGLVELWLGKESVFNQPNSIFGLVYYALQILLGLLNTSVSVQLILSTTANIGSVYLGYILFYVLNDFCVVCVTLYVVNFLILLVNLQEYYLVKRTKTV